MARIQEHEIRRRADGSIDTGFYAARADTLRRTEITKTGDRLAALFARLKAALRKRGADEAV